MSLLCEREHALYAQCTRLYKCLNPTTHAQFVFESKERTGGNALKVRNLNFGLHLLLGRVNELCSELNKNARTNSAWKRANRSDTFVKKTWREISSACITQFSYRRDEINDLISFMLVQVSSTSLLKSAAAFNVNRTRLSVQSMDTDDISEVPTVAAANRGNAGNTSRHGRHIKDNDRRYH